MTAGPPLLVLAIGVDLHTFDLLSLLVDDLGFIYFSCEL